MTRTISAAASPGGILPSRSTRRRFCTVRAASSRRRDLPRAEGSRIGRWPAQGIPRIQVPPPELVDGPIARPLDDSAEALKDERAQSLLENSCPYDARRGRGVVLPAFLLGNLDQDEPLFCQVFGVGVDLLGEVAGIDGAELVEIRTELDREGLSQQVERFLQLDWSQSAPG